MFISLQMMPSMISSAPPPIESRRLSRYDRAAGLSQVKPILPSIAGRCPRPRFDDIDLLVMDVRMPGASGLEIARILRYADATIPVVLITAFPDAEVIGEVSRLGLYLLAKPFALDRLSDTAIAALLDTRRSVELRS